jgi:prepilin-type N-terminal cleavage/methylation domain-containing protein
MSRKQPLDSVPRSREHRRRQAFTLVELMIVVAIMGIVMSISVPFMHGALNKRKGMDGAVRDVQEACKFARDWSILRQTTQELRIHPHDGVFEVGASTAPSLETGQLSSPDINGGEWRMVDNRPPPSAAPAAPSTPQGSFRVQLPQGVIVEGLGVNGDDWTDDEVARVQFRKNGTCDEMSVVLYRAETNERRNVWLEVVTGLANIESDPLKFKSR